VEVEIGPVSIKGLEVSRSRLRCKVLTHMTATRWGGVRPRAPPTIDSWTQAAD